jgi:hypothetical protein
VFRIQNVSHLTITVLEVNKGINLKTKRRKVHQVKQISKQIVLFIWPPKILVPLSVGAKCLSVYEMKI